MYARRSIVLASILSLLVAGCAHYRKTTPLQKYDLRAGYRFEELGYDGKPKGQTTMNSDDLFVVLAFSGGGTRAGAFSYGVLQQLKNITFTDPGGQQRRLLDEVDVISSVSGGSFTAAYYALRHDGIFDENGPFHTRFLYYPTQRDLFAQAVYYPHNWLRLRSRPEIAADLYGTTIFDKATFADLVGKQRPYLVMNSTDMSAGARFEFTQEQFDMLCGDLTPEPIARGVAASSAFPGLLNSMTIDNHNAPMAGTSPCGYTGPGSGMPGDWTINAFKGDRYSPRYFAAEQTRGYLNPDRTHFHLLDGGLADNIGARAVYQSLTSTDRPTQRSGVSNDVALGGWSVMAMMNNMRVKTVLVIIVDAKTKHETGWDTKAAGPGTPSVINVSSGVPMGNFSRETLMRIREELSKGVNGLNQPGGPKFYGMEIAFANLPSDDERSFFANLGTNFNLDRYEVDCLIDRGGRLVRDGELYTGGAAVLPFTDFVRDELHGTITAPPKPFEPACTAAAGRTKIGVREHYLDIGVQAGLMIPGSNDVHSTNVSPGVVFRATRPNGWGVVVDVGSQSFPLQATVGGEDREVGDVRLFGFMGGIARTRRDGRAETTIGMSAGYGIGRSITFTTETRDAYGRLGLFGVEGDTSNAWIVKPQASFWYNLTSRWAATVSGSWVYTKPTVRITSGAIVPYDQQIEASAVRVGAGIAFKIF
jgi:NTE family protein